MLQGPGENAGVLDLGDGVAVAFKVESHNHPSAVEPFQGAATGVGGILRDIIAMGARPIALLDGLRFGEPDWSFSRAVGGIGHYGNAVGVPNVGGEVVFDEAYRDNCLVNAMCVGLLPVERLMRAKATGAGQLVVLYGATTGRDGIGGASVLASQELDEDAADKRPSVQVGDPFTGKKLIEASVELVSSGLVESLQDCGAAGLASSLSEMAAEFGIDVHLDRVPQREEGMEPWEVMISESQERMVAIVRPNMLEAVETVLGRWELEHAVIGEVTTSGSLRAHWEGALVGDIPARFLTDECPRYEVEQSPRPPAPAPPIAGAPPFAEALVELLGSPALRSRAFVFRRYDQLVGSRTVRRPGLDAAVLRLRPSMRGVAVSLDGQGRIARLDPYTGGALAVLEAARNVACVGGEPLGFTDCLNFGNPEKPEVGWELAAAIDGIAAACEALSLPVVSGNVSLYNETNGRAIHPTPVVGAIGLVEDVRRVPAGWREGDTIFVASASWVALAGSEYQARYGELGGTPPPLDLDAEARLVAFLWRAAPRRDARPRRLGRRARDLPGRGRAVLRARSGGRSRRRSDRRVRRGRRTRRRRVLARVGGRDRAHCEPVERPARGGGSCRRGYPGRSGARAPAKRLGARRLMCGVFGIRSDERDVSRLAYFGLFALQHRGQESAGIAVSDEGRLTVVRDMGLVAQVFDEQQLQALPGEVAIGHTRYSTTGANRWANAQPLIHHGRARTIALGHNGNLVNVEELRTALLADDVKLDSGSDSELIAALIARDPAPLAEAVANAMRKLEGAYSVTALSEGTLVAFRDPLGFRPLTLGRIGDDWVVASESCALDLIGAEVVRDVQPGEVVWIDENGLHAAQAVPAGRNALCIFEHVYLARPDSRLAGVEVHGARVRMGETLAREAPADADLVIGIPDSGTPAAIGFSKASGIPFNEALIKNRYVARTFIQPDQAMREQGIRMKFNPLDEVDGKRIVVVDDTIVRANTTRQLVAMLFDSGAAEVHVRISSPPVVSPCFYGIDFPDEDELAAARRTVEEVRQLIGATSLHYLSVDGMQAATTAPGGLGLPRLLHARLPDSRAAESREAPLRAGARVGEPVRPAPASGGSGPPASRRAGRAPARSAPGAPLPPAPCAGRATRSRRR